MTRFRHAALAALVALLCVVTPGPARAEGDYDIQSGAWNGLQGLVHVAQEAGIDLRPSAVLDWASLRRGDGLLVLYPLMQVDRTDLTSFLEDGGRLALLDDFGDAEPLLEWFRVSR